MASGLAVADPSVEHSGDESEDDDDVVEQSPCGRWEKRRQEVQIIWKSEFYFTPIVAVI